MRAAEGTGYVFRVPGRVSVDSTPVPTFPGPPPNTPEEEIAFTQVQVETEWIAAPTGGASDGYGAVAHQRPLHGEQNGWIGRYMVSRSSSLLQPGDIKMEFSLTLVGPVRYGLALAEWQRLRQVARRRVE